MKFISIGDLVTDYYYKNGKLIGVNGGMTSHNIIANLKLLKNECSVFGVCGDDKAGEISIKSLKDIGVDTNNVLILENVKTRCFHVSYFEEEGKFDFISKKRCPVCNEKKWYVESLIDVDKIKKEIKKKDVLVFDNLNVKNQKIINSVQNIKMLDLGQYFEFEKFPAEEIIKKIKNKFAIINLNERVEKYLLNKFDLTNMLELSTYLSAKLLITTRGKKGADFVYNDKFLHLNLENISKEVDSTGAGDAFFSIFISEYINNQEKISEEFIMKTFKKATRYTSKVVKLFGSRGHINKLYKIKKITKKCTCEEFLVIERKQMKRCLININNLERRVLNGVNSSAYMELIEQLKGLKSTCLFLGTGGSFAAAHFASKIVNEMFGITTISKFPREVNYRNNEDIFKIFLFSYSGTTADLLEGTKNIDNNKKIIITKGEFKKVIEKTKIKNIVSYRTNNNKGAERGFLSFEGVLTPASLFLNIYLKSKEIDSQKFIQERFRYWEEYFKNYFKSNKELKRMLKKGKIINLITGDYTTSASLDLESKIIESGIYSLIIHEKKNFSHGRFINYENQDCPTTVYLKQKNTTEYEIKLLKYLSDNTILIESEFNGILAEYDLLIASQFFIVNISKMLDIDISKPKYSEDAMKIYFHKGEL